MKSLIKAIGLGLATQQACATIAPGALHQVPHVHAVREQRLVEETLAKNKLPSYNFSVPIDHFHNETKYEPHSDGYYDLRYWVDDTYYKPGGPIIMIGSGELTSVLRIPYVETGIGKILAEATGGLTVLLEHRYYGTSYPVPDLSPKNMRFLSTEQAMADTAYFVRNIQYPGLEDKNLTSYTTPYIMYGGSYAGAFAALMRKVYPDDIAGAISGSGVTKVILDYWEYLEAARLFVEPSCVEMSQKITDIIDKVLTGDEKAGKKLKGFFELENLADDDFAYFVNWGLMTLQATHWDPDIEEPDLAQYCASITSDTAWYSSTRTVAKDAAYVLEKAGYGDEVDTMLPGFLNWIGRTRKYIRDMDECKQSNLLGETCLTKRGAIDDVSIPQGMLRPWTYQTCTQWAYFVTGSGTPEDQMPLMSRLVDFDYATMWCPDVFGIPAEPDADSINHFGEYGFSHHRLAFVDGEHDPWRQAGVHRLGENEDRESTDSEPFILIEGAVHHWDEFGPKPNATGSWLPPKNVQDVHQEEIRFVKLWLKEWAAEKAEREGEGVEDYYGEVKLDDLEL